MSPSPELLDAPYVRSPAAPPPVPSVVAAPETLAARVRFVVHALRRRWWLVLGVPAVAIAVVFAVTLARPRTYTATATFMPEARRGGAAPAGLSGIAAQFGVGLAGGDPGQAPPFYVELVRSGSVLRDVVDSTFTLEGGRPVTWVAYSEATGRSPEHVRANAVKALSRAIGAAINPKTSVIGLQVRTESAAMSLQLNEALLRALNRFNLERRQSQAVAERRFAERRLAEARAELRQAEDRLLEFMARNRAYGNSPELTFQQERLQREVGTRQGVVASLTQSYEQARIDAVRDTPVITVVEAPVLPLEPDPRGLPGKGLLSLVLGAGVGAGLAVWLAARDRARAAAVPSARGS